MHPLKKITVLFVAALPLFFWSDELVEKLNSNSNASFTVSLPQEVSDTLLAAEPVWQRPEGPARVALQVGHWKNSELPDELKNLRERGGGTSGGGKAEWEVNLAIAEATAKLLEAEGVAVDILPATVPPAHWADVFISIHADGNTNSSVSGYKIAAPRRDATGRAEELAATLEEEYGKVVNLPLDPNITRNMRGYYAFNWRRYEHSMHRMATAAIVETGFLTSPADRKILINEPELAAQGIANGVMAYLKNQQLL